MPDRFAPQRRLGRPAGQHSRQASQHSLPASRPGRRACLAVLAAVTLAAGTAGCAKFNAALGQQWATVQFKPDTSVTTLLKVRAACSHVPNTRAEALPAKQDTASMIYALKYRTDHASDANLAQLQQCLQKFPQVAGIDFEDSGDAG
ncbi:MAG TPA: hypothetical protein VH637_25805 [Streptosporangiaceae bacterium]